MAERKASVRTIFHILDGESPPMYLVDAAHALNNHPTEWREKPWPAHLVEAYKKRKAKEAAKADDEADEPGAGEKDTAEALDE